MNKKRLVGGEFLLDLSMIALATSDSSESFTAITNQEVLTQLTDLKTYVKNQKSIKPIWVKLKDNDSFIVTRGELQKVNNQPNFVLVINANGKLLTIKVEFTQVLNDDDVPMDDWYIDTNDAQYNLYVSDTSFIIDNDDMESISDDILNQLKCGDVVIKKTGNQYHTYVVTYKEHNQGICLTYADCGYIETISYDYTSEHWVFNSKDVCYVNQLENIKDSAGHNRFIEGDVIPAQTLPTGFEIVYSKWSLSGSHLMFVVAGNIANGTVVTGLQFGITKDLPQWVKDKIYPVVQSVLEYKTTYIYGGDYSSQAMNCALVKTDDGDLRIQVAQTLTATADRTFRISYDLLIDNE